jgi:hypothetical protein
MRMYYENNLRENQVFGNTSISNQCIRTPALWMSVVDVYTFLDSSELWFWRKTGKINWTNLVKK